jgi:hypothetical protein
MNRAAANSAGRKFVDFEFIEQRIVSLTGPYTGNVLLVPNQRCYFGPNTKLRGKRIVHIDVLANTSEFTYNDAIVGTINSLPNFTLTILNTAKEEALKDYPVTNLHRAFNFGKLPVFDIEQNIEESYIQTTDTLTLVGSRIMLFNFYTVSR